MRSCDFIRFDLAPESGRRRTFFSRRRRNPPQRLRGFDLLRVFRAARAHTNRTSKAQITRAKHTQTVVHVRTQAVKGCVFPKRSAGGSSRGIWPPAAASASSLLPLFPAEQLHTTTTTTGGHLCSASTSGLQLWTLTCLTWLHGSVCLLGLEVHCCCCLSAITVWFLVPDLRWGGRRGSEGGGSQKHPPS